MEILIGRIWGWGFGLLKENRVQGAGVGGGWFLCLLRRVCVFFYLVGNRFPGVVKGIQALLPYSFEKRITDMILRGEGVSGDRKRAFPGGERDVALVIKTKLVDSVAQGGIGSGWS